VSRARINFPKGRSGPPNSKQRPVPIERFIPSTSADNLGSFLTLLTRSFSPFHRHSIYAINVYIFTWTWVRQRLARRSGADNCTATLESLATARASSSSPPPTSSATLFGSYTGIITCQYNTNVFRLFESSGARRWRDLVRFLFDLELVASFRPCPPSLVSRRSNSIYIYRQYYRIVSGLIWRSSCGRRSAAVSKS